MALGFLDTVLDVIKSPLEKLIPDRDKRNQLKHEISVAILDSGKGQLTVNAVEAAHKSIFVAGWRPFIGWVCGFSLAYHFILRDLFGWLVVALGADLPPLPFFDISELMTILLGMLGMGGLRTYEKLNGVAREK